MCVFTPGHCDWMSPMSHETFKMCKRALCPSSHFMKWKKNFSTRSFHWLEYLVPPGVLFCTWKSHMDAIKENFMAGALVPAIDGGRGSVTLVGSSVFSSQYKGGQAQVAGPHSVYDCSA